MVDASPTGYGVIRTPASVDELREEACLAGYGGWTLEGERALEEAGHLSDGITSRDIAQLPLVPLPRRIRAFRIGCFMMGPRRDRDVEDFATRFGARLGCLILVENRDMTEGIKDMNFLVSKNLDREFRLVAQGYYDFVMIRVTTGSWSRKSGRSSLELRAGGTRVQ